MIDLDRNFKAEVSVLANNPCFYDKHGRKPTASAVGMNPVTNIIFFFENTSFLQSKKYLLL